MDPKAFERLEGQLHAAAQAFEYPPTPPLIAPGRTSRAPRAATVRRNRRAWVTALALVLLLLAAALSVPQVRAAVAEFLQIGVVRIRQGSSDTPSPAVTRLPTASPQPSAGATLPLAPTPGDLASIELLGGETTLEDARQALDFPVLLPAGLGKPDRVYLQELRGDFLILVWTEPQQPERVRLALHVIQSGSWALEKVKPRILEETTVNGRPAVWAAGPYLLIMRNENSEVARLVDGNVLIWEQAGLTYRLESQLTMEAAIEIAESIE